MQYRIIVLPCDGKPGMFEARLEGRDGVLCISRSPFLDSARVLLAEGASPDAPIVMRHAGADFDSLSARVGYCASLSANEPDKGRVGFIPWKPHPRSSQAAPIEFER